VHPDNSARLAAAARRRHEMARSKTIHALHELEHAGAPVTFETVARAAAVSRSWLYTQPDIRDQIHRLREAARAAPAPAIPARQRGSDPSLIARLEAAHSRIAQLTEDNQRLRRQLALALGQQRDERARSGPAGSGRQPVR
jgi:hypothetical protein